MTHKLCETCNLPIPEARLEAVPNATQCVPCKEEAGDDPARIGIYILENDLSSGTLFIALDEKSPEKPIKRKKKK